LRRTSVMLNLFFFPGKRLMRLLRMPAKFALIIATLLVPLSMLTYLYVAKANADLDFVADERIGVKQELLIGPISDLTLQHRGQALLTILALGDESRTSQSAAAVEAALSRIEQALAKEDPFELARSFQQIKVAWRKASTVQYVDVGQITANYTILANAIGAYQAQVSEQSKLSLDPDVASYYLMIAGTDRLPSLISNLAPLRGLAAYAAAKPEELVSTRLRIASFMALVKADSAAAKESIARADAARPDLVSDIDTTSLSFLDQYLTRVQSDIMAGASADPTSLFNSGSAAITRIIAIRDASLSALDVELAERQTQLRTERLVMLFGVSLALMVAAYCLVSFFMSAQSGFRSIADRVERLGRGDLVPSSAASGKDEISESINRFRVGIGALAVIIRGVRESAESISQATAEIAAGNNDLAERGSRIAGTVQKTSENMNSLAEKVSANLASARQATQLSSNALKVASSGELIVAQAMEKMTQITVSSRQIGEITEVINSIAFQTNILALNAAVEAARAGEQGRGFAVVATEVRNLAQRSATAAKEIGDLIQMSMGNVEQGASFVNRAGDAMGNIVQSVQQVSDIVAHITSASNLQSSEIGGLATAVAEVDASTQENAAMVEEIAAAVMSLAERATFLSESVRSFKINVEAPRYLLE
jgi:methyl-accepting chemotaxis protein